MASANHEGHEDHEGRCLLLDPIPCFVPFASFVVRNPLRVARTSTQTGLPADKASALQNEGFRQSRFAVPRMVDPLDNGASVGYDSVGSVAWRQDPEGHLTYYGFRTNGRQFAVTDDSCLPPANGGSV